jgi:hypothetical protein
MKIDELFDRWRNSTPEYQDNFCCDGIIHPEKWNLVSPKVLIVLKESNNYNGDLRSLIRDDWQGARSTLWNNVGRWVYGIQQTTKTGIPLLSEAEENLDQALLSTAILNLKKKPGGSSSDNAEIMDYAVRDSQFIKNEIKIINPDVIICGNTFNAFMKAIAPAETTRSANNYSSIWGSRIILNYWHPSARYPKVMMYYTLLSIYQMELNR